MSAIESKYSRVIHKPTNLSIGEAEALSPDAQIELAKQLDLDTVLGQARELYLEIGCGINPRLDRRVYRDGLTYLGVDGGSHDNPDPSLWTMTEALAARAILSNRSTRARAGEAINFFLADGRKLPLADEVATEVYMANVVGNGMSLTDAEAIITESHRLLRPTGQLVIRETITPLGRDTLTDLAEGLGFRLERAEIDAPKYQLVFAR